MELKDIEPVAFILVEKRFGKEYERLFFINKIDVPSLEPRQGDHKLYTEEQLEQAEQIGMLRIWDLLPESYQKEFLSTRDEVIKEHLKFGEPQDSLDEVMKKINSLISEYDFPLSVLQDVNQRLNYCPEVAYAKQQLRYLQNIKKSMEAQECEE